MRNAILIFFIYASMSKLYAAGPAMISYIIVPRNMPDIMIINNPVTESNPYSDIKLNSPAGNYSSLISDSLCVGEMKEIDRLSHWLWLEAAEQGSSQGIDWKFKFAKHDVGPISSSSRGGRVGYSLVAKTLPPKQTNPGFASCTSPGKIQNRDYYSMEFNGKVDVDMSTVSSGKKQIIIPMHFALEEKWQGPQTPTTPSLGMKVGSYMLSGKEILLKIDLDVQANCDFGGINTLNISHGIVSSHEPSNKEYSQPVNISCRKGVTAKISFAGDRLASGMRASAKNIECAGGVCSLLFDVSSGQTNLIDQSSASVFIQDKAQLKVSSIFMPSTQTVPGPFSSNAALVISFE